MSSSRRPCRLWSYEIGGFRRYWCYAVIAALVGLALGDDRGGRTPINRGSGKDGWSVQDLPSPTLDPVGCKRPGKLRDGSFVCNPDELLSISGAQRVDHELGGISKLESPCGGRNSSQRIEGGVAMISRMLPYPGAPVSGAGGGGGFPVEVEAFAQGVQDAWRIGKRGCNNGFLLFASKEDRNFAISVGSGLEPYLTPKDRKATLSLMKPLLRKGDWDTAVLVAVQEIGRRLQRSLDKDKAQPLTVDEGSKGMFQKIMSGGDLLRGAIAGGGFGGGGGGGGGLRDIRTRFFEGFPEGTSGLLLIPLVWGAAVIGRGGAAAAHRKRYDAIETKLQGIEAQSAMVMVPPPALTSSPKEIQAQLAGPRICPICLESFSQRPVVGGVETVGADGLETAEMQRCGHEFCQSCLQRWQKQTDSWNNDLSANSPPALHWHPPGSGGDGGRQLCPICDHATPLAGDPRLGPGPRPPRRRRKFLPSFGFGGKTSCAGRGGGGERATKAGGGNRMHIHFDSCGAPPVPQGPGGQRWRAHTRTRGNRNGGSEIYPTSAPPPPPPPPPPLSPSRSPLTPPPPPRSDGPEFVRAKDYFRGKRLIGRNSGGKSGNNSWENISGLRRGGSPWRRRDRERETEFLLVSLRSQYPNLLGHAMVNRRLSTERGVSWTQDAAAERLRMEHGEHQKGSGWMSSGTDSRSRDGGGFSDRRSFGGGSSSTTTGGRW